MNMPVIRCYLDIFFLVISNVNNNFIMLRSIM